MIELLLMAAVAAGAYWAGTNSRHHPPAETARPLAPERPPAREPAYRPAPLWPWVVGAAVLGLLLLGMSVGPPGPFGGPGLFAGLMGP